MRIAITGGTGFLGWHTSVRLQAIHRIDPIILGRDDLSDPELLAAKVANADVVIHLAGVNRAETDEKVEHGNAQLAVRLSSAIRRTGKSMHVVYGNSSQSQFDSPYGRGKAAAGELLNQAVASVGGAYANVVLPNIFGEHGKPHYNSFVATFCHEIAHSREPKLNDDRVIPLLHAQAAAEVLIQAAMGRTNGSVVPAGEPHAVSEILARIQGFKIVYDRGEIPDLSERFAVDLFNTYRSYVFPQHFPFKAAVHADSRGSLFETVRAHGGSGQTFVSTTVPGATRGEHFHLRKFERFFVVAGEAEISLRRLRGSEVIRFRLRGTEPAFVDMPTMWVHNIRNVGKSDLITMFWADQLLDNDDPDQYPEQVLAIKEAHP